MRTAPTSPRRGHGGPRPLVAVFLAVMCGAAVASAQPAPAGSAEGFSPQLSATVGLAVPGDATFRDVYGSALIPVALQVDWPLGTRGLVVFAGVRHVRSSGEAVVEESGAASGQEVRFRMTSARFGAGWQFAGGAWKLALAGGPTYNFYREEWEDFDLVAEDRTFGLAGQASLSRTLSERFSFLLRAEYSWATAPSTQDPTLPDASLGAVDIVAGIAVRF